MVLNFTLYIWGLVECVWVSALLINALRIAVVSVNLNIVGVEEGEGSDLWWIQD